jgi:hypothetical protein
VGLGLYGPLESKTPATMLAELEDRAAAAPLLRTATRRCPPNAGPRADCGHGDAVAARGSIGIGATYGSAAR